MRRGSGGGSDMCGRNRVRPQHSGSTDPLIHLLGPGGAGKSTIGSALAERHGATFVDLDQQFTVVVGGISDYIDS